MNRTTSLYLDIVRPLAAVVVLLSHLAWPTIGGGHLTLFKGAGGQAVDVFFVLSGFVIAHVCATRETGARDYAVSRAVRIYSVAIPAFVITLLFDRVGSAIDPGLYANDGVQVLTAGVVIRCLLFLNEHWNTHRFPGSNGPFWSLGFEVWYYIAFGVFRFTPGRWRWPATALVLVFIGPKVAILFPVWLMGVATYHATARLRLPAWAGWPLLIGPVLLLTCYQFLPHPALQPFTPLTLDPVRLWSTVQDYGVGLLFCLNLVGVVAISGRLRPSLERHATMIRWVAGATFSLYLMHVPLLYLIRAASPWPAGSLATLAALLTLAPLGCLAIAELSERRKGVWRRTAELLMRRLGPPLPRT